MNLGERAARLTALGEVIKIAETDQYLQFDDELFIKLGGLARNLDATIAYSMVARKGKTTRALVAVNSDNYCPDSDDLLTEAVGNNAVVGLLVYDMKSPAVVAPTYSPLSEILFAYVFPEGRSDVEKLLGIYRTDPKVLTPPTIHDFLKILPRVEHAVCLDQFRGQTTELEPVYRAFLGNTLNINYPDLPQLPQIELNEEQTETSKATQTPQKT